MPGVSGLANSVLIVAPCFIDTGARGTFPSLFHRAPSVAHSHAVYLSAAAAAEAPAYLLSPGVGNSIVEFVNQERPDVLVMGARILNGLQRWVGGWVGKRVALHGSAHAAWSCAASVAKEIKSASELPTINRLPTTPSYSVAQSEDAREGEEVDRNIYIYI